MLENVIDMLKKKNLVVPGVLFFNTGKLGINYDELYFLTYVLNLESKEFDMVKMGKELNIKPKDVLKIVNDLCEKNLIKLDVIKKDMDVKEVINLDALYHKMAFISMEKKEKTSVVKNVLFDKFESEFKRPLTPREYQIINVWKEKM